MSALLFGLADDFNADPECAHLLLSQSFAQLFSILNYRIVKIFPISSKAQIKNRLVLLEAYRGFARRTFASADRLALAKMAGRVTRWKRLALAKMAGRVTRRKRLALAKMAGRVTRRKLAAFHETPMLGKSMWCDKQRDGCSLDNIASVLRPKRVCTACRKNAGWKKECWQIQIESVC
jgi:hypothetical protein